MRSKTLAHNIGLHIEKLANDGIEGWGMTASEVIKEMLDLSMMLEKLAKEEALDESEVSYLKSLNLHEVIVPEDLRSKVIEDVMGRYRWERAYVEINGSDRFQPNDLFDLLSAINRGESINEHYYSDVVIDRFNLK